MKQGILIAALLFVTASCKTVSYESAVNVNKDRFYGDDKKTALLLDDLDDVSQLSADISNLAQQQAYSKDLCKFANLVVSDQHKQGLSLKILAFRKKIKLPNTVGEKRQKIYRSLQDINDEKTFDRAYYNNMDSILTGAISKCDSFMNNAGEGPVRNYIARQSGIYKEYVKKINQLQNYMNKSEVPQLTEK